MEKFRKTIRTRFRLLGFVPFISILVGAYGRFFAEEAIRESHMFLFQSGALTSISLLSLILMFRYRAILDNDEKLKQAYHRETDERYKAIRAKAGMPMLLLTSLGMIVAGVIAGYYNQAIFIILLIAATCQMLVGVAAKFFWMKKM